MVSENPRNSGLPRCSRCGLGPDEAIHRLHPGHRTHPFALTPGEAVSGRLGEARTRLPYATPRLRELTGEERAQAAEQLAPAVGALIGPVVHDVFFCGRCGHSNLSHQRRGGGCDLCARGGCPDFVLRSPRRLAAEQLERGGHTAFEGPRLHEILREHFRESEFTIAGAEISADLVFGGLRLAIADALRRRLGSSPALEDFVLAPDAAVSR